jgi:hypothetical protein
MVIRWLQDLMVIDEKGWSQCHSCRQKQLYINCVKESVVVVTSNTKRDLCALENSATSRRAINIAWMIARIRRPSVDSRSSISTKRQQPTGLLRSGTLWSWRRTLYRGFKLCQLLWHIGRSNGSWIGNQRYNKLVDSLGSFSRTAQNNPLRRWRNGSI